MKKILVVLAFLITTAHAQTLVGNSYTVIFPEYNSPKIDTIVENINQGKVKKIVISYDNDRFLADWIADDIKMITDYNKIVIAHVHNRDTNDVTYNHKQVSVSVYTE